MNDKSLDDSLTGAPETQPILEVRNITKRFPGVLALDKVSVKFFPGEVHAVVGENGAGKSTLMKIVSGAYVPDSGDIFLQSEKVQFAHPIQAYKKGVSIIYQEFNLLPERTVAQNIFLGREPARAGVIDIPRLNEITVDLLTDMGVEKLIEPTAQVSTLSVAAQQIVEIAKAISYDSKVLIMDEPTASLTSVEVKLLDDLVMRLKAKGMAIIFISHRLVEVFEIAEKITVLKDGQFVNTVKKAHVTPTDIVTMMVGRELDQFFPPLGTPEELGEVVLRVKNASNDFLKDINMELRKGEVLGVAGLQGSGRTELAQALFGVEPFKSGQIEIHGASHSVKSPFFAISKGMGFVTEDRKSEGIFPQQPIRDNILTAIRALQSIFGILMKDGVPKSRNLVSTLSKRVDVRTDSFDREVQFLSGGNQQKVVLAKWLASDASIFIFDEPTRGIDVEAKASIHDILRNLTKQGVAVLMISSELPEIIGMSDRVLVMWDGRIAGELPAKSSESEIMLMATGHANNQNSTNAEAGKE